MNSRIRQLLATAALQFLIADRALAQEQLVQKVEDSLRSHSSSAVHDFGSLLRPQGIAELQQQAERLKSDSVSVHFVTVPPGTANPGALAETVYRDLKMGTSDVVIVYDGQRVYGTSLALKGEPEAFRTALKESQAGFSLYAARGLAQFADSIDGRIVQRRHSEIAARQASEQRVQLIGGISLLVLVLGIMAIVGRQMRRRAVARKFYADRLHHAEKLFERIALAMPGTAPRKIRSGFLRLDHDLQRARERKGKVEDLDRLIEDCKAFERDLAAAPAVKAGVSGEAAETTIQVQQTG